MPLWRSVNEDVEIGDRIDGIYFVAEIRYKVPIAVKYNNYYVGQCNATQPNYVREYNTTHPDHPLELISETPKRYARLEGAQMDLLVK